MRVRPGEFSRDESERARPRPRSSLCFDAFSSRESAFTPDQVRGRLSFENALIVNFRRPNRPGVSLSSRGDMQIPHGKVLAGVPGIGHSSAQAAHTGRPALDKRKFKMFSGRGESPHRR